MKNTYFVIRLKLWCLRLFFLQNLTLKREKAEIEKSRDRYKKQSQALCFKLSRLQDDLDKQVKSENETLR